MVADGYKNTEIGVIPENWNIVKLSDIMNLIHGYQFRTEDFTESGICVIKIKNVSGNKLELNDISYIASERYEDFKQYKINVDDILMSLTGNIGRVIEVNDLPFAILQNYRVGKFEPISQDVLYKKYIKFIFSSNMIFNKLQKLSNQSAQANFGKQDMDKLIFPLPPLKEQEKIADILSTTEDKIDAIASQIQKAETLKKGLLQKLLSEGIGHSEFKDSELGKIPESWEVVKLDDVSKIIDSLHLTPSFVDNGIAMVRVSNIKLGELDLSNTLKVTEETFLTFTKNHTPKKGNIVLGRVGIYRISSFVATDEPFCIGQNTVIIEPFMNNKLLYHIFNSKSIVKQIDTSSYGSGHPSLSLKSIKKLKIPLPPLEEQKQIADILSTSDKKLEVLRAKKEKYQTLKKGLLQKLLSGEVRVGCVS